MREANISSLTFGNFLKYWLLTARFIIHVCEVKHVFLIENRYQRSGSSKAYVLCALYGKGLV